MADLIGGWGAALTLLRREIHARWPEVPHPVRGRSEWDYVNIREVLVAEGFGELPSALDATVTLRNEVEAKLSGQSSSAPKDLKTINISVEKMKRDAELLASTIHHARVIRERDPTSSCYLVTSSRRFQRLSMIDGDAQAVVLPLGAIVHLISMLPGVAIGLSAMKSLLFEDRVVARKTDLQSMLLRVIRDSEQYDLPFARRHQFSRKVREVLLKEAVESTNSLKEAKALVGVMEHDLMNPSKSDFAARVVHKALDEMAIDSNAEKRLAAANRTIARLEAELLKAKQRLK